VDVGAEPEGAIAASTGGATHFPGRYLGRGPQPMPSEIDLMPPSILLRTLCVMTFLLAGACSAPRDPAGGADWTLTRAAAQVERAWGLAGQGREAQALALAHEAGARAEAAGHAVAAARAHLLVARLEDDLDRALWARALLAGAGDAPQRVQGALELARLADRLGQAALAEEALAEGLALAGTIGDHRERGRRTVPLQAERARRLATRGRTDEAHAAWRQARLALTLVPDGELAGLRAEVHEALAARARAEGELEQAIETGARAAFHAREAGRPRAEIRLLAARADDLLALGRRRAAADEIDRAFERARALGDRALTDAVARQGLAVLATLGEDGSARHNAYSAALVETP